MKRIASLLLLCLLVLSFSVAPAQDRKLTLGAGKPVAAAGGSVSFDAKSNSSGFVSTLTFSHVMGSGSNGYLAVMFAYRGDVPNFTSVTWNGTAMNARFAVDNPAFDNVCVGVYELVAPASGTHDVVITLSVTKVIVASAISYTGVNQTTPIPATGTTTASGTNNTPTATLTPTGAGSSGAYFSFVAADGNLTDTPDTGWTTDSNVTQDSLVMGAASHKAGASSVTRTDTLSASATAGWWVWIGYVQAA